MAEVPGGNIEEEALGYRELDFLTRESAENISSILLPPEPVIGPETEFIVKQELVE